MPDDNLPGEIDGKWHDVEEAALYDEVLGPGNRPEHLEDADKAVKEGICPLCSEELCYRPGTDDHAGSCNYCEFGVCSSCGADINKYEAKQEEEAAPPKEEAAPPKKPPAPAEEPAALVDTWTTVSGKLLASERDAFKAACKDQGVVPSKLIRAFVASFIKPEGEEAAGEPEPEHSCKECNNVIGDDYYTFGGAFTCGDCVTKLIKEKEGEAYKLGMDRVIGDIDTYETQPSAGSPESPISPEEPAQPPQPVAELKRVECAKCLGESFVPEVTITWTCAVCAFVNSVPHQ